MSSCASCRPPLDRSSDTSATCPCSAARVSGYGEATEGGRKGGKKGEGAKQQPQVMMDYIDRGLYPFRVSWPEKKKDVIIVLAAHTQAKGMATEKATLTPPKAVAGWR